MQGRWVACATPVEAFRDSRLWSRARAHNSNFNSTIFGFISSLGMPYSCLFDPRRRVSHVFLFRCGQRSSEGAAYRMQQKLDVRIQSVICDIRVLALLLLPISIFQLEYLSRLRHAFGESSHLLYMFFAVPPFQLLRRVMETGLSAFRCFGIIIGAATLAKGDTN